MPDTQRAAPRRERAARLLLEIVAIVFSVLFALAVNGWREEAGLREKADRIRETIRREIEGNREAVRGSLDHHRTLIEELATGTRLMEHLSWERLGVGPDAVGRPEQIEELLRPLVETMAGPDARLEIVEVPSDDPLARDHAIRYRAMVDGEVVHLRWNDEGLEILGTGNIALQPAALRNTAWSTLQISGAALFLNVELLERASAAHQLQSWYLETVSKAVDLLYSANLSRQEVRPRGFLPTLRDLAAQEGQLLELYDETLVLLAERQ